MLTTRHIHMNIYVAYLQCNYIVIYSVHYYKIASYQQRGIAGTKFVCWALINYSILYEHTEALPHCLGLTGPIVIRWDIIKIHKLKCIFFTNP